MTTTNQTNSYDSKYPDVMPWSKRIFLLQKGQMLQQGEKLFVIKQVIHSRLNDQPRLALEEVNAESGQTTQDL